MIYTHVLQRGPLGITSPLDKLPPEEPARPLAPVRTVAVPKPGEATGPSTRPTAALVTPAPHPQTDAPPTHETRAELSAPRRPARPIRGHLKRSLIRLRRFLAAIGNAALYLLLVLLKKQP